SLKTKDPSYDIIEWIGRAYEPFIGKWSSTDNFYKPGYSEFIDLDSPNTNADQIKTPGSHLSYAHDILLALSDSSISLESATSDAAIIFKGGPHASGGGSGVPMIIAYNWDYSNSASQEVYRVYKSDDTTLKFTGSIKPSEIYEYYYLAWTAYAIVPEKNSEGDFNLTLYYDYRPWKGEKYSDGKKALLISHIKRFRFLQQDRTIEFGLCAFDKLNDEQNVTFCGKKVVF
ncbi:MAG: hypothetical protein C6H99_01720, partial [Epsilonproteobacteria bacterium]|nr:hypothetical protein [Campylobacterota bacterium]NPA65079.1 hypothetical protein [Campylobacterota bacterium]